MAVGASSVGRRGTWRGTVQTPHSVRERVVGWDPSQHQHRRSATTAGKRDTMRGSVHRGTHVVVAVCATTVGRRGTWLATVLHRAVGPLLPHTCAAVDRCRPSLPLAVAAWEAEGVG